MSLLAFISALGPGWPKDRGWYALGLFMQTAAILAMIVHFPELRSDEFFKSISTAIVITGWVGFAVGLRDPAKDREQISLLVDGLNTAVSRLPPHNQPPSGDAGKPEGSN